MEVKYGEYEQGVKFVEYFEDIKALENKIECCDIEIEKEEGIKAKVMK
jgi:hypothetical protein